MEDWLKKGLWKSSRRSVKERLSAERKPVIFWNSEIHRGRAFFDWGMNRHWTPFSLPFPLMRGMTGY